MKKFIIMSLTALFALILTGCGKDKDKECKEGEKLVADECVKEEPAPDAKPAAYIKNNNPGNADVKSGDASLSVAKDACVKVEDAQLAKLQVSIGSDKVCDNSDTDSTNNCAVSGDKQYQVDANKKLVEITVEADKIKDTATCKALAKPAADPNFSITNLDDSFVKVSVGNKSEDLAVAAGTPMVAAKGGLGCVIVKKSEFAKLKIEQGGTVICNNADTDANNDCVEDNLEIKKLQLVIRIKRRKLKQLKQPLQMQIAKLF